jgi:hypothetical protein
MHDVLPMQVLQPAGNVQQQEQEQLLQGTDKTREAGDAYRSLKPNKEFILPITKIWSVACIELQFQFTEWSLRALASSGDG